MESEKIRIICSGGGKLFNRVRGKDAMLLHYLMNYKITKYNVVYFPKSALPKEIN